MDKAIRTAAISPLRQRLIDDMNMRRFSRETQRNYIRDVGRFATFLGRSPDTATADDVRRFQIEQRDAGMPTPTMNSIVSALRFFFTHTIDRPSLARKLIRGAGVSLAHHRTALHQPREIRRDPARSATVPGRSTLIAADARVRAIRRQRLRKAPSCQRSLPATPTDAAAIQTDRITSGAGHCRS